MFLCNKPGRTLVTVYLEDIAEKLEEASDHWEQYLNVATGEFEYLPDGEYVQPDKDLAERIGVLHIERGVAYQWSGT